MVMENFLKENLCIKQAAKYSVLDIHFQLQAQYITNHPLFFNSHSVAWISRVVRIEIWMVDINKQEDK